MGDRWDRIPADAFMEILRRLPPSHRRLRLVCRHWRSVIDDRTPPTTQARAKVLAFVDGRPRAYVLDDLTESGTSGRELELPRGVGEHGVRMVGMCNGLLCLLRWRGDLVVVNPVTGEMLAVPPAAEPRRVPPKLAAHSFTYHPATGLYKIVHVPCDGAVKVFTLGDRSWREVPLPVGIGTSRLVTRFGITSVDGATYWVAADAHSVMSLNLKDERVVRVATLPVRVDPWLEFAWHLTKDLRGRLIFAAVCSFHEMKQGRTLEGMRTNVTKVWMLEDGGRNEKQPAWVLQCQVVEQRRPQAQEIAWPHVTHGEHVLTTRARVGYPRVSLHACPLSEGRTHGGVVQTEGSPSIGVYDGCESLRTFAYVETMEPLAFYGANDCEIGDSEDWDWRFDDGERRWKLMPRTSSSFWYMPPAS